MTIDNTPKIFTAEQAFKNLPVLKPNSRILLLTHNDLDGSGPALLLQLLFTNVTVEHVGNGAMSWKIRNAVVYDDNSNYDYIIVTDISVNEKDAEIINQSPNRKKLILIDHHDSAEYLNQYNWACVVSSLLTDSAIKDFYPEDIRKDAHSSATSLTYDYLNYHKFWRYQPFKRALYDFLRFIHTIAAFDTWDWYNLLDQNDNYTTFDTLFDIYSQEIFEEKMLSRLHDFNDPLIRDIDIELLDIEKRKIDKQITNVSKVIQTGNICIHDTYYSIVFCHAETYILQTFEYMKNTYPDYDLYIIDYGLGLSIRAISENIHVGMLLKEFGGGGHVGAGGIRYSMEDKTMLIEKTLGDSKIIFDKKTFT